MLKHKNDIEQQGEITKSLALTENIDEDYLHCISDEIYLYQPFLLSMLLGYKLDTMDEELDEITKIFLLIWEAFKEKRNMRAVKLTEQCFELAHDKNIEFLKRLNGEGSSRARKELISNDLKGLESKGLFGVVLSQFHTKPALVRMEMEKKGIILAGIKSVIEALEEISRR